jgi:hypothetical protein
MTEKPMPEADLYEAEEIAAEYLLHAGEVALGDRCDELDRFSDAALADQLVTERDADEDAWAPPHVVDTLGQHVSLVVGEAVRSHDPAGARRGISVRTGVAVARGPSVDSTSQGRCP